MPDVVELMKHNVGGELNPIQTEETLLSVNRQHVYSTIYVAANTIVSEQVQFEADARRNKIIRMEV